MAAGSATSILAVLVLYKVAAESSPAFTSLQRCLAEDAAAAAALRLVVCDNSPIEQPRPANFGSLYLHDPSNPGLARCYNQALALAEQNEVPWLMLLDQDTTVTAEYLREAVAEAARASTSLPDVVAVVPKLVEGGRVQSPQYRPTLQHTPVALSTVGVSRVPLFAFNSGSVVRVQALRAIGGFPEDFRLDFLDHATFHMLQAGGGRVLVLHAFLAHELASNNRVRKAPLSLQRYRSILAAERLFLQRFGTRADRLYRKIRLLRFAARTLLVRRQVGLALLAMREAIGFRSI